MAVLGTKRERSLSQQKMDNLHLSTAQLQHFSLNLYNDFSFIVSYLDSVLVLFEIILLNMSQITLPCEGVNHKAFYATRFYSLYCMVMYLVSTS